MHKVFTIPWVFDLSNCCSNVVSSNSRKKISTKRSFKKKKKKCQNSSHHPKSPWDPFSDRTKPQTCDAAMDTGPVRRSRNSAPQRQAAGLNAARSQPTPPATAWWTRPPTWLFKVEARTRNLGLGRYCGSEHPIVGGFVGPIWGVFWLQNATMVLKSRVKIEMKVGFKRQKIKLLENRKILKQKQGIVTQKTKLPGLNCKWSCRFSPTPSNWCWHFTSAAANFRSQPMPLFSSTWGEPKAPAARITSPAQTSPRPRTEAPRHLGPENRSRSTWSSRWSKSIKIWCFLLVKHLARFNLALRTG